MTVQAHPEASDPYNLQRFLTAHEGDFARACAELKAGRKETHWIWFIFPQMRGLGVSRTSDFYGIGSLAEAKAYLAHPQLGPRLEAATRLVLAHEGQPLLAIFGTPDDKKFCSSMTLFSATAGPASIYADALARTCDGKPCERTLALLRRD